MLRGSRNKQESLRRYIRQSVKQVITSHGDMASSFDKMTHMYSFSLRLIAILPFDGRTFTSMTSRGLLFFWLVSSILHWSMMVSNAITKAEVPTVDAICETVLVVGLNLRYYLLLPRRLEFVSLLSECRSIWYAVDEEDRHAVRHFERKVRLLFRWLLGSCVVINVAYGTSAVIQNFEAARMSNGTHGAEYFLPYKWFIESSENSWPGYKFNFALQLMLVLNAGTITASVDTAAPLLIMLGAGYFRAVQRRLYRVYDRAMKSGADYSRVDLELLSCCRLHQRILSYCTRINEIARTLFFVQLMCTGYNTSLIGIKLAGRDPDRYKYMPVVLLNLGQLFICQWAPDHLIDESAAISTTAYYVSFPWMRRRVGKLLVLMIARAQRPVRMTAAGVFSLSLENFGTMLKGALSFFTLLRNFNI